MYTGMNVQNNIVIKGFCQCGVVESTTIRNSPICTIFQKCESAVCINQRQKDNTEVIFIIEIQRC